MEMKAQFYSAKLIRPIAVILWTNYPVFYSTITVRHGPFSKTPGRIANDTFDSSKMENAATALLE